MKRILVALLAVILTASCTASLPARFTRLADKVESKGANFTEAQWEKANARFRELVQEYKDNYDSLDSDQKKEINAAIMKYCVAVAKSGVGNAIDVMHGILEDLPDVWNGLHDCWNDILNGADDLLKRRGH